MKTEREYDNPARVVDLDRLRVTQAHNGHVWVYDKENNRIILHINTDKEYTTEDLTSFAERLLAQTRGIPLAIWTLQ